MAKLKKWMIMLCFYVRFCWAAWSLSLNGPRTRIPIGNISLKIYEPPATTCSKPTWPHWSLYISRGYARSCYELLSMANSIAWSWWSVIWCIYWQYCFVGTMPYSNEVFNIYFDGSYLRTARGAVDAEIRCFSYTWHVCVPLVSWVAP